MSAPEAVQWLQSVFTAEDYLRWSRIQGSLWTLADIIIVFYALKLGNAARAVCKARLHRYSFWILYATLPFALLLPATPNALAFFRLELAITLPHFALLLYVLWSDPRHGLEALRILERTPTTAIAPL